MLVEEILSVSPSSIRLPFYSPLPARLTPAKTSVYQSSLSWGISLDFSSGSSPFFSFSLGFTALFGKRRQNRHNCNTISVSLLSYIIFILHIAKLASACYVCHISPKHLNKRLNSVISKRRQKHHCNGLSPQHIPLRSMSGLKIAANFIAPLSMSLI